MRRQYTLTILVKPPMRAGSIPIDPADAPAVRRYKAIMKRILHGQTEAEAVAAYDTPHTCSICSEPCHYNADYCTTCGPSKRAEYKEAFRRAGRHLVTKTCLHPDCTTTFTGHPKRKWCDQHKKQAQAPKAPRKPYIRKPKKVRPVVIPRTWDQPRSKPEPVQLTIVASTVTPSFHPIPHWSRWSE